MFILSILAPPSYLDFNIFGVILRKSLKMKLKPFEDCLRFTVPV